MTSHVTTHVLDAARGRPAQGVAVRLEGADGTDWISLAAAETDSDGRVRELGPEQLEAGDYRLTFATGAYFERLGTDSFYPQVQITFRITDPEQHYHVPVLLSPFSYSTYRGS
ncbi:5-hydroxyisourate hydrolase [Saccharopolyspora erythraea NRRL 2338]|uniref:5-hydroxyisourate hydrolase n=2 Tax=Saccharopolyspora erythraea TaxID=1836 RepID=A4FPC6_SACEN|nr:hydroxyisourate hydrolase [Saccharopolyspora erythraea]EQD86699.1 5-hydroxyisourate hydrolase [Saccharopolyspora erythraea D]PFG99542.1 5-hydroxyisourate hydrolase [Saccharopolyspora erythraea NRRL 2338]QRK89442.1 hydroxyisourate hydrolase [Saccharopolyspora erythraea]CAM05901.1 transthyretin [Saccharopolyspora erythraea NRRL 2338]